MDGIPRDRIEKALSILANDKKVLLRKRLDFDTLLILRNLPYNPQQKQLGIKINKACDNVCGFFHLSNSTIVVFKNNEVKSLIKLIKDELKDEYNTIGDAGKLQHALNQLTS